MPSDIDECALYDPCNTACTNTMGSFTCSCNEGFELGSDGLTCQGRKRPTAISSHELVVARFSTIAGVTVFILGPHLLPSPPSPPKDVNECLDTALMENVTLCAGQQLCENTDGSYTCKCPPGTVECVGESSSVRMCIYCKACKHEVLFCYTCV